MSHKVLDRHNRWRSKTVAFRMSPEENEQLNCYVRLSGMSKQDYIIARLLHKEVIVQGNPRVYKALRNELHRVLGELERIRDATALDQDGMDRMDFMIDILHGMKEETDGSEQ